jgi:heterodisulfide reductase subunit A-like polyferredoxin
LIQTISLQTKVTDFNPGAGVGGVATAARLSKAGLEVTVLEKNEFTGGRCSLIHKDGHVCSRPLCTERDCTYSILEI